MSQKKYLDNQTLVRYGKNEVESNPKKNEIIKIEKWSNWKTQLPLINLRKNLFDENNKLINPYYYEKIYQILYKNNFLQFDKLLDNFQQVWIKKNIKNFN